MRTRDFVTIFSGLFTSVVSLAGFSLLSNLEFPEEKPSAHIRLANHTDYDFQEVVVGTRHYGPLKHGAQSSYRLFVGAYSYDYIEAHAADKILCLQPTDFVGESYLAAGAYTYILTEAPGSPDSLDIILRHD